MHAATILLAWTLALASALALVQARRAALAVPDALAGLKPRGAALLARRPPPAPLREQGPDGGAEPAPRGGGDGGGGELRAPVRVGDVWELDFAHLEFDEYDPPDLRADEPAPLPLEAFPAVSQPLHGQRVRISGYMQVTAFEAGRVRSFVLARFPAGCCFGGVPQYDEWIDVELAREAPAEGGGRPVTVVGRLEVGEELSEDGYVLSLYRLRAARVP